MQRILSDCLLGHGGHIWHRVRDAQGARVDGPDGAAVHLHPPGNATFHILNFDTLFGRSHSKFFMSLVTCLANIASSSSAVLARRARGQGERPAAEGDPRERGLRRRRGHRRVGNVVGRRRRFRRPRGGRAACVTDAGDDGR